MLSFSKNSVFALFIFVGSTVGAGIFGIPYVVSKSGVIPAIFYFLILGGIMLLLNLFFGEIFLRTKENCRLAGLSRKYLGKNYGRLTSFSVFVGLIGALLAYIILGGKFLSILLSSVILVDPFYCSLFFGLILIPFIFKGVKVVAPLEIFTNACFFIIIFIIFILGFPKINFHNFTLIEIPNILLPYGVILFSLAGMSAIPEAEALLKTTKEKKSLKKIIITSFVAMVFLYAFFTFIIVGISGKDTSVDVFQGLIPFLGPEIIFIGSLAAFITLADSFLVIAICLRNSLVCDQKMPKLLANSLVTFLPIILFLIGLRGFIEVIGFLGTLIGAVEGVIIILLFRKAKELGNHQPEYTINVPKIVLFLCAVFLILGAVIQFVL
ncbi:MAG: aromatic amino acid transport family protein [Candidatus Nealsonbacteria bacterium]